MKKKKDVVTQKKELIAEKAKKNDTVEKLNPIAHPIEYAKLKKRLKQIDKELTELGYTTRPTTAQKTIAYEMMYENGICKVKGNFYNKMLEFSDINYDLLEGEDKAGVLEDYSSFINFFDPTVKFNMFLFNRKINENVLKNQFIIERQDDGFDDLRDEYEGILKTQSAKGKNGIVKSKYFVFGCECENYEDAVDKLETLELDIIRNFMDMGTFARTMDGNQRLQVMYEFFNQGTMCPIKFDLKELVATGSSEKDLIASHFDFSWDESFKIGNMYGTTCYINIIAPKANDEFIKKILEINDNLSISIHMTTMDPIAATNLVNGKLTQIQANKIDEQKKAVRAGYDMDILPAKLMAYEQDTKALADDLNSSNQKLVNMTLLVTCFAKTQKGLASLKKRVDGIVQQGNQLLVPLRYMQEQALMSCSPIGFNSTDKLPIKVPFINLKTKGIGRILPTRCCAVHMPFCTQELFMPNPALYYGLNTLSRNMIMADRKELRNPNGLVLGTPGSGKSFSSKREMLGCFLTLKDDILICDPEGEYYPIVKLLNGQVVKLANNSHDYINPLDLVLSKNKDAKSLEFNKEAIENKSAFIITLCDNIAGGKDGLDNDEKGIIDECVKVIYKDYIKDPVPEKTPILEDLFNALNNYEPSGIIQEELTLDLKKKAVAIASNMTMFVHGSQNFFNHRTTADTSNRVLCFDIRDLSNQLKSLGMLIVQDAVWNRVSLNRDKGISTRYYCDEFHLLLREKQTGSYMVEIWKRFRKWGGIPTGLTQNSSDFLRSPEIEGIIGNSDFIYLLNQSADDQDILQDKLHLTNKQLKFVTDSKQGSGLIKFDNIILPFTDLYPTDTKTYKVMSTKPQEMEVV